MSGEISLDESARSSVALELPQFDLLDEQAKEFLLSAKRFLAHQAAIVKIFFQDWNQGARFDKMARWAMRRFGENDPLAVMLQQDQPWISFLNKARDAIEHPKPNQFVEISNVSLLPGNRFASPSWRFRLEAHSHHQFSDIVLDMNVYVESMMSFAEELLILCLEKSHVNWLPYAFYRVPDNEIDPRCPIAYDVTLGEHLIVET
jgi:hypothetical protein